MLNLIMNDSLCPRELPPSVLSKERNMENWKHTRNWQQLLHAEVYSLMNKSHKIKAAYQSSALTQAGKNLGLDSIMMSSNLKVYWSKVKVNIHFHIREIALREVENCLYLLNWPIVTQSEFVEIRKKMKGSSQHCVRITNVNAFALSLYIDAAYIYIYTIYKCVRVCSVGVKDPTIAHIGVNW